MTPKEQLRNNMLRLRAFLVMHLEDDEQKEVAKLLKELEESILIFASLQQW